jgi:hypothetical protein
MSAKQDTNEVEIIGRITEERVFEYPEPVSPVMGMIEKAISNSMPVEALDSLFNLYERQEGMKARKAFAAAVAAAKSEITPIVKRAIVDYMNKKGDRTHYGHETLADIDDQVDPILAKHNLSTRYRSHQKDGLVFVTCILEHADGHFEETTLSGTPDQSGSKNNYQAVGSAVTYLQRYTKKIILGLSAAKDDDATTLNKREADPDEVPISEAQFHELQGKIAEAGVDEALILTSARVKQLPELTVKQFKQAMRKLEKNIQARES